jgi:hypothetical protein
MDTTKYDTLQKLKYRTKYLENKRETETDKKLYEKFGGKAAYYKMKMLEFCNHGKDK